MTDELQRSFRTSANLPPETLIINRSESYCNNCGWDCLPNEEKHQTRCGYVTKPEDRDKGCQVAWKYVSTDYSGDSIRKTISHMRPDLEFKEKFQDGR